MIVCNCDTCREVRERQALTDTLAAFLNTSDPIAAAHAMETLVQRAWDTWRKRNNEHHV